MRACSGKPRRCADRGSGSAPCRYRSTDPRPAALPGNPYRRASALQDSAFRSIAGNAKDWRARWDESGHWSEGILREHHAGGRPTKLAGELAQRLLLELQKPPPSAGYPKRKWSGALLTQHL